MSEVLKRLTERRVSVWESMKALAERAADENRQFSGEEQAQWEEMEAEIQALDRRRKSIADAEKRAKDTEEAFSNLNNKPTEKRTPQGDDAKQIEELRTWLQGRGGRDYVVKPPEGVSFRDLTKGSATAGGNTVPQGFYGQLVEHLVDTSGVMQAGVTVLNTTSGETLPIPKTTAHGAAAQVAEATALAESDPTFGVVNLGAYKYGQLIQVSRELVDDTGVDLMGYLARAAGRNLGLALGAHLVTGDGSSKPRGIVTDASSGVVAGNGIGAVTSLGSQNTEGEGADFLVDLFYSVISPYRNRSSAWLMKDSTAAVVRKLKSTDGVYAWQPSLVAGTPDTILGRPVFTDPNVAAMAASAKSILFGDFSQYFVRLAGPVRFERSDDFAFSSDLVTFRAILRADAALVDLTGAVKYFQNAAS